ncbi:MAG: hypothetical protein HYW33_02640 [Candidatus Blackburnbacteria bacterium]|nr:hypothetical protein [Candidatus Blackburnbacteria bacterium]
MLSPLVVFSAAAIDSINPCAISVLFLTIGFLFSLKKSRGEVLRTGMAYVTGIFLIYVLVGLGTLRALSFFGAPHILATVGALIVISTGVVGLLGTIFPKFPIKLKIPQVAHRRIAGLISRASIPAAFSLGFLVGMYEFPCTGGPYLLILGLLHDQATFISGFFYLAFYNLIFVAPLVIILLVASSPALLEKVQEWKKKKSPISKYGSDVALIVLGLVILLVQ